MPKLRFIWLGLIAGVFYWLLESILHTLVFSTGSSLHETLLGENDPNEIMMRGIIIILLTTLGFGADAYHTRQQHLLEHSERINRLLQFLSYLNQLIQHHTGRQEMLDAACKATVDTGLFCISWIAILEKQAADKATLSSWAVADPSLQKAIHQFPAQLSPEIFRISQLVLRSGKAIRFKLCKKTDCDKPWQAHALEHGCEYGIAMPLKVNNEIIGVFALYADKNTNIEKDDQHILNSVANNISVMLANIKHIENLHSRLDELERFQKATMQREERIKALRDEVDALQARLDAKNTASGT